MDALDMDIFSPLANLRDLGGLRVRDGVTRPGVLWRSDDIALAPIAEIRRLRDDGLTTVLDLRSPVERERAENAGVLAVGLDRHELAFFDLPADPQSMIDHWAEVTTARALGLRYISMVHEALPTIVQGLSVVAGTSGVTLFHCSAGKDRTGIFAAAVLACVGATSDVIVGDYARTSEAMPAVLARMAKGFGAVTADIEQFVDLDSPLLRAPAEAMEVMLDEFDHDGGGLVALLRHHGLTDELVETLAAKLVDG